MDEQWQSKDKGKEKVMDKEPFASEKPSIKTKMLNAIGTKLAQWKIKIA